MLSIFQKFLVKSDLRWSTQAHNFEGLPSQAGMQWGGGGTASQLPLTDYGGWSMFKDLSSILNVI